MLEDHKRTGAYYNAVMRNKRQFHDKVVLDVGTGSGILAIFAAMAGARKVYAVEATDMATSARKLADANKVRAWVWGRQYAVMHRALRCAERFAGSRLLLMSPPSSLLRAPAPPQRAAACRPTPPAPPPADRSWVM